jgi:glycosyltransferase involved in cell wall biosynthesis
MMGYNKVMENTNKKTIQVGINASFLRKPNTGIGQVTLNFLKELSSIKSDNVNFVLYLEEDLPKGLKLSKSFQKEIFLPPWKRDDLIRKIWWEKFCLPKKVKRGGCDVFLSLYQCPTFIKNIPHIMLVHDIIPKIFPEYLDNARKELYWKLTEKGIRKADKIIAVSKRTEKDLIEKMEIPAGKISVNYISVDEIYKKEISQKESARVLRKYKLKPGYILAGGGYEIRKNVSGVVQAYKILLERNKNLHFAREMPRLVIYGKIFPLSVTLATDIVSLTRKLNLTQHVTLLDMVPQKDMPAVFANAEMFVYPSHYEGFGMPPLEAMSVGTPTIVSKTSSLPEVGGDAVLYCHSDDPKDIAMVMQNVLINRNLRETLSRRGKERAERFSWEGFTEKFLEIIKSIQ